MRSGWTRTVLALGEGRKSAIIRPQKTAAKNSCVRCRILQEWDSQVTALTELQFLEGPLRRVFFLDHRISFRWLRGTGRESEWPRSSLPEYFSHSKRHATFKCFF